MVDGTEDHALAPIAQSREAFDWLELYGNPQLEKWISAMADRVKQIAPDCVALSVAVHDGDLTFTLTADRHGAALLDAVQYLDGGPCVEAVDEREVEATRGGPTDEDKWQLFAAAEVFTGIASTLSLPLMDGSEVIGGVNLYGSTKDAFEGRHAELAEACGAEAQAAVTNADLRFTSRVRAAATPGRLQDRGDVYVASGIIAEHQHISTEDAQDRIHDAAVRAGVTDTEFARFIIQTHAAGLD